MMGVMLTPETLEIEERKGLNLSMPKFLWTVLEQKAKAQNKDLQTALNDLVTEALTVCVCNSIRAIIPVPVN